MFNVVSGNFILVWKRGNAVLTAGPMKVTPDTRVRLLSTPQQTSTAVAGLAGGGYSLELRDVKPTDAGDYVCQLGTLEPIEIVHTLEILGKFFIFFTHPHISLLYYPF